MLRSVGFTVEGKRKRIVKSYLETSYFRLLSGRRRGVRKTTSIRPITFDIVTRISVTPFQDLHSICIISVAVSSLPPSLSRNLFV